MSNQMTVYIGDGDLRLLGMAAALAARFHGILKNYRCQGLPGFPQSDAHALQLLLEGIDAGARLPLDDVPELMMAILADSDLIARLKLETLVLTEAVEE